MRVSEIRKQLIKIVRQSSALPEIICIVLPEDRPYGGAYLPVYGFNTKHDKNSMLRMFLLLFVNL
jgi:hypothetical protein